MSERHGYGLIQTYNGSVFENATTSRTSSLEVADYNNLILQLVTTVSQSATLATASVMISSSLNGTNWVPTTLLG